jgi:hypothetical protein
MNKKTLASILLVLSLLFSAGAALTLFPFAGAGKPNMAGYRSLCSFTPVSTAIMLFLAYSINGYRVKIKGREESGS